MEKLYLYCRWENGARQMRQFWLIAGAEMDAGCSGLVAKKGKTASIYRAGGKKWEENRLVPKRFGRI